MQPIYSSHSASPGGRTPQRHLSTTRSVDSNRTPSNDNRPPSPMSSHQTNSPQQPARSVSPIDSRNAMSSRQANKTSKSAVVQVRPVIVEDGHNRQQPSSYSQTTTQEYEAYARPLHPQLDHQRPPQYQNVPYMLDHDENYMYQQQPQTGLDHGEDDALPTAPPSKSPPRQPEKPPQRYSVISEWSWDIASLVSTLLLFMAIILLLHYFNGSTQPDWGQYMNFNTALALLSTGFRASLVVAITSIISQRKWSWFAPSTGEPRPLGHLQQYEEGSRNSFKAIWLFTWVLKCKDIVSLVAAIVFLLSFLVGPFVQQSSQTLGCSTISLDSNATFPFAQYLPRAKGFKRGYAGHFGQATSDTMVSLLSCATSPKGMENQMTFKCPTGNCTFIAGDPLSARTDTGQRDGTAPATVVPSSSTNQSSSDDSSLPFLVSINNNNTGPESHDFMATTHSTAGICRLCTDISSSILVEHNVTGIERQAFHLRNMTVMRDNAGANFNMTSGPASVSSFTGETIDWLPASSQTELLQTTARYALANTTILTMAGNGTTSIPNKALGMTCQLYPCLRTYSTAVINGQLRQVETKDSTSSDPIHRAERQMWPSLKGNQSTNFPTTKFGMAAASYPIQDFTMFFAAIKSPCRLSTGEVYIRGVNMSTLPQSTNINTTTTTFISYQPRILSSPSAPSPGPDAGLPTYTPPVGSSPLFEWVEHTVPNECLYIHDNQFFSAVSLLLRSTIFKGTCATDPRSGPHCSQAGKTTTSISAGSSNLDGDASGSLVESVLADLYQNGAGTAEGIDDWFAGFADAVTTRWRAEYGGSGVSATAAGSETMEAGVVSGTVWTSEVCIRADMRWLAFPGVLLGVTLGLFIATVWGTWRDRWIRPVWKDSVLVYLFYCGRFGGDAAVGRRGVGGADNAAWVGRSEFQQVAEGTQRRLLDTSDMQDIADRTMVTFEWPASVRPCDESGYSTAVEGGRRPEERRPVGFGQ